MAVRIENHRLSRAALLGGLGHGLPDWTHIGVSLHTEKAATTGSSYTGSELTTAGYSRRVLSARKDTVGSIKVTNGGSGYASAPSVTLAAPGGSGTTATATAILDGGSVVRIDITDAGSGYSAAPSVTVGGAATATALLGFWRENVNDNSIENAADVIFTFTSPRGSNILTRSYGLWGYDGAADTSPDLLLAVDLSSPEPGGVMDPITLHAGTIVASLAAAS